MVRAKSHPEITVKKGTIIVNKIINCNLLFYFVPFAQNHSTRQTIKTNFNHVLSARNPTKNFSILKMGKIEKKLNFFFQLLYNFQKKNTNNS